MAERDLELATAYWAEFEYRHSLYWSLYTKAIITIAFLVALPFAYADRLGSVFQYALIFPTLAFLVSLIGGWMLLAELFWLRAAYAKWRSALADGDQKDEKQPFLMRIASIDIGLVMTISLIVFGLIASFGVGAVILGSPR